MGGWTGALWDGVGDRSRAWDGGSGRVGESVGDTMGVSGTAELESSLGVGDGIYEADLDGVEGRCQGKEGRTQETLPCRTTSKVE